jgi:nicotinamidase-related amidase
MSAQVQAATPAEAMPIGPACMEWRTDCDGVPKDIAIRKQKPSVFFGTNLAIHVMLLCCDIVIIAGTTTSGSVRLTASALRLLPAN